MNDGFSRRSGWMRECLITPPDEERRFARWRPDMKKTFLAAAVALGALAISVPAQADPRPVDYSYTQRGDYRGPERGDYRNERRGYSREAAAFLGERIDRGFASGRLTHREAERLSWRLSDLRQRARFYWRTDGISWSEQQDLDLRFDRLREDVRYQMHDDDRRFDDRRYDDRRPDDGYRGAPPPRRY
jgi:hypothetical protein